MTRRYSSVLPGVIAGARAFAFSDVDGLAYLYDPTADNVILNGSNVQQVDDTSSNDRHASNATASEQPEYDTSGSVPAVVHNGTDDFLATDTIVDPPENGFVYAFAVASADADAGNDRRRILDTRGGSGRGWWLSIEDGVLQGFLNDGGNRFVNGSTSVLDGNYRAVEYHTDMTGGVQELFIGGVSDGVRDDSSIDAITSSENFAIGHRSGLGGQVWKGGWRLLAVYYRDSALSSAQIDQIRTRMGEYL